MDLNGLPTELEQFVQQEIAEGRFASVEAVVSAALRLLQEHEGQGENGQPSANGSANATPHSAEDVIQAISDALATGKPNLAQKLALQGTKQYPDHAKLQKYAHVLAPPVVRTVPSTPESRASVKANGEWLKTYRQDYLGRWVALRNGELLGVKDSYEELIADLDDSPDTLLTNVV